MRHKNPFCNTRSFVLLKAIFCKLKGGLLQCKRPSFKIHPKLPSAAFPFS